MRARMTSSKRGAGAMPDALAAADSGWEDAAGVIAAAGEQAARLGGGFRRRDGWDQLIRVGRFRSPTSMHADQAAELGTISQPNCS